MQTVNSKNKNLLMREYIFNAIQWDGYELPKEPTTDKEKIDFLFSTFVSEYCYKENLTRFRYDIQKIISEWLSGLPSAIAIDFYNWDILERGKDLRLLSPAATEVEEDEFLNNWFNLIAAEIIKLARLHNVYRIK